MEYLGLYNKSMAEVHPGHKLMGPIEEEEEREGGEEEAKKKKKKKNSFSDSEYSAFLLIPLYLANWLKL
jgi:hypothetical protein